MDENSVSYILPNIQDQLTFPFNTYQLAVFIIAFLFLLFFLVITLFRSTKFIKNKQHKYAVIVFSSILLLTSILIAIVAIYAVFFPLYN